MYEKIICPKCQFEFSKWTNKDDNKMEIKTTKQICFDNEVSWYDGYHTKWVSVDSIIPILEEHYNNIRKRRKDCTGLQILQYPISDLIEELRK